jgi:hypothetical protein
MTGKKNTDVYNLTYWSNQKTEHTKQQLCFECIDQLHDGNYTLATYVYEFNHTSEDNA